MYKIHTKQIFTLTHESTDEMTDLHKNARKSYITREEPYLPLGTHLAAGTLFKHKIYKITNARQLYEIYKSIIKFDQSSLKFTQMHRNM